ncbi:MAG: MobF family relaxase, partial [Acidimicrobiales bacterium]
MRLAKLSVGAERYYLSTVAAGYEDHRPEGLEPDGVWMGTGSAGLGLGGQVTAPDLELVVGGGDPRSRNWLNPAQSRVKVVGYDLVWAAPKSVSVFFGLADSAGSEALQGAHSVAVGDAIGYLERSAVFARRSEQGRRFPVATSGVVAAGFVHRTSRATDPHLHTHVLVANLVEGVDGRWSALDARGLYAHAVTAGYLYHARLRHELVHRHGLAFGSIRNGVANLVGVPAPVLEAFSQRRRQVLGQLQSWGTYTPRAAQAAALATRPAKDTSRSVEQLRDQWQDRAARLGLSPDRVSAALGERASGLGVELPTPEVDLDRVVAGLVERGGTFGRRDLLRGIAQALPDGAEVASIEQFGDQLAASGALLELTGTGIAPEARVTRRVAPVPELWHRRDGSRMAPGVVEARWTTVQRATELEGLVSAARHRASSAGAPEASQVPASQVPASQVPASQVAASQVAASQVPASQVPASQVPASQVAASPDPGSSVSASPDPG